MDHVLRYQDTPGIKMIVVLGEVRLKTGFLLDCLDCSIFTWGSSFVRQRISSQSFLLDLDNFSCVSIK